VNNKQNRFRRSYRSMDLSALERVSKALEKSLDLWGLLLLGATAVVVFGLVIEYWHDAKEFWTIVHWPMAAFPLDKFKTLLGGILVTLGVAGELLFTYKASRVETDLRNNSHRIEALLTRQSGDAKDSAQKAQDSATIAEDKADAVGKQYDDLLKKYNAAERALEVERRKRLALAASLLPRKFADQSGAIARLKDIPPREAVFEFPDEREPRKTAEQINFVLANLHWTTWRRRTDKESEIPDGITVSTGMVGHVEFPNGTSESERRRLLPRILEISRELSECIKTSGGIDAEGRYDPWPIRGNLPPETLLIRVGPKPNPLVEETLRELGPQLQPTPLTGSSGGMIKVMPGSTFHASGVRTPIAEQPPPRNKP